MKINWFENKEMVYLYLTLLRNENGRKIILALNE